MKFLNEIDGANRVKTDATNRFVTDAEKTAWNGKQNALGYTPVNKAGDTMTGKLNIKSDTSQAMLNLPRIGTANPTSTTSGDVWYRGNNICYDDQGTVRVVAHTGSWSTVPQAEAEAGTATIQRLWTAQRVKQAILALSPNANIVTSSTPPAGIIEGRMWIDTSDNAYQGTAFDQLSQRMTDIESNVPTMVYDDNGVEKAITKITFSADGIKLTVAD